MLLGRGREKPQSDEEGNCSPAEGTPPRLRLFALQGVAWRSPLRESGEIGRLRGVIHGWVSI